MCVHGGAALINAARVKKKRAGRVDRRGHRGGLHSPSEVWRCLFVCPLPPAPLFLYSTYTFISKFVNVCFCLCSSLFLLSEILCSKISSEMEVALRYTLLTLFILFKLLYTAWALEFKPCFSPEEILSFSRQKSCIFQRSHYHWCCILS